MHDPLSMRDATGFKGELTAITRDLGRSQRLHYLKDHAWDLVRNPRVPLKGSFKGSIEGFHKGEFRVLRGSWDLVSRF